MKKTSIFLFSFLLLFGLIPNTVLAQCGSGQSSIDINIDFTNDIFPDEDGWKIINTSTGVAIDSACFGDYSTSTGVETITLCLDTGITYSLYLYDDYGDGMDGSEYRLAYTYGNAIDTIGSNNFNISQSHCNAAYSTNEIEDSTSFYVAYVAPPNCLVTDSLNVSNITTTSADLNWRENNSAIEWEVQYDTIGFILGTGIDSLTNSNPKSLAGLSPDTEYDFYVRSICGIGDTSAWSLVYSFKTAYSCPAGAICATYTTGNIQTDRSFTTIPGTSTCAGSLNLTIPAGNRIDSVSTRYNMTALTPNNAWISEQRSWLYSTNTTTGEASITSGVGGAPGTYSYERTGLTIANSVTGTATFELHAGRTFGGTGCTNDYSIVDSATWIVTAYYSLVPACLEPISTSVSNITSDSALISWAGTGTATKWVIEYDTTGYTAGTSSNAFVVLTDTFTTITGLTELSTYDFYVRSICGIGDTSSYTSVETFTTPCDASVAPFTESFDNSTLPSCWSQSSTSGGPWVFGTPGFTWNTTGCTASTPSDHTGNSGNYVAMDHSATDVGVILEMPTVDVSALTTPFLEFYFTMCGSGYTPLNLLHIEAYNGSGWDSVSVIQQGTNGWELFGFDISGFTFSSDFVRIRFRAESGGSTYDYYGDNAIDDVSIDEAPTCPNVSTLIINNITSISADLDWTENGTATIWEIEYDTTGYVKGSGNDSIVTSKPFSWSSLTPNTTYTCYVRSICSAGDTSDWVGPITFTTDCPSSFSIPYTQSFDSFVPNCWEEAGSGNPTTGPIDSTSSNWSSDDYLNSGIDGMGAKINLYTNNREDWILSPSFDLSTGGPYQVSVDAGLTNWNNTAIDSMGVDDTVQVLISTDLGVSWTALYTWDTSNEPPSTGTTITIDLSAYSGTTNNFAIWASDGAVDDSEDYDFHIGNFTLEARPVCNEPSILSAANVSTDTAALTWTENGTAAEWEISYGITGFTAGNGTQIIVMNNPFNLSGLTPDTDYDWYVRAICGAGDSSIWSDTASFKTLAIPTPNYSIGTINTEDANGLADSLNVECIISGTVTGVNRSATGYKFALIDLSNGFQEGITVFNTTALSYYTTPAEGDSLLIWGTVDQTNGLTQFIPDSISTLISGTAVVPIADLTNIIDESTESILIELMDDYVLLDPSSNGSYTMRAVNGTDTISISVDAETDVDDSLGTLTNVLVIGDTICGLVGIGSQFDNSSPFTENYLIVPNNYSDISICRLSVGLDKVNVNASTFSIAPNPTNGEFIIQSSNLKNETIRVQVRDISGKVISNKTYSNNRGQFRKSMNLNGNAKGIYFISISDGEQVINKKMILK